MSLSYFPQNAVQSIIQSCLVPVILTFFVNHMLKFKFLAKRMSYAKVDRSHLNPDAKRLTENPEASLANPFHLLQGL